MSQEEKAKAYDGNYKVYTELINRLEDVKEAIKKQNYGIAMDILYKPYSEFQITTHSELKESEDKKIRKALVDIIEHFLFWKDKGLTKEKVLAWLEKQGKQSPIDVRTTGYWHVEDVEQKSSWSEEDEVKINRIVACLENLNVADNDILLKDVDWLKSLKDRYTWKPSDEQMERLKGTINSLPHQEVLYSLYQDLKKLKG